MVQTFDEIALSGSAGNGRVQRRIQNHLGLLERRQLMKVAQELEESHLPRQMRFAEASKHSQVGLQQGKEALRSVLMHITAGLFLLRVVDIRVEVARERPIAAGRVGQESAAPLHSNVGGLLHRLDGKVPRRLDADTPLAADPGDDRGSVFVVMAPPGLPFLAAPPWLATQ